MCCVDRVYADLQRVESFNIKSIREYVEHKRYCMCVHSPDGAYACERAVMEVEEKVDDLKGAHSYSIFLNEH